MKIELTYLNFYRIHFSKIGQEYKQINLFSNVEEDIEKEKKEKIADKKEKNLQKALLEIKSKYGKNAVLKGMNLEEGATAKDRNAQIGGHKA